MAFNAYLVLLSWPTIALGWIIGIWQRGMAGWVRVRELLATRRPRPAIADADRRRERRSAGGAATPRRPSIEVRDLTIAVDGRRLLDGVSFSLPAGATLAIVGPTGAGKTTLVDAICACRTSRPAPFASAARDVTRIPLARAARA